MMAQDLIYKGSGNIPGTDGGSGNGSGNGSGSDTPGRQHIRRR